MKILNGEEACSFHPKDTLERLNERKRDLSEDMKIDIGYHGIMQIIGPILILRK